MILMWGLIHAHFGAAPGESYRKSGSSTGIFATAGQAEIPRTRTAESVASGLSEQRNVITVTGTAS
jgi:hypothetical protein